MAVCLVSKGSDQTEGPQSIFPQERKGRIYLKGTMNSDLAAGFTQIDGWPGRAWEPIAKSSCSRLTKKVCRISRIGYLTLKCFSSFVEHLVAPSKMPWYRIGYQRTSGRKRSLDGFSDPEKLG